MCFENIELGYALSSTTTINAGNTNTLDVSYKNITCHAIISVSSNSLNSAVYILKAVEVFYYPSDGNGIIICVTMIAHVNYRNCVCQIIFVIIVIGY